MQRPSRRSASAEASYVSQMDPWKDDRCRDFIALNTIQRLRSYHSDTMLPVEPVNSLRAKNLCLLPKAEPDEMICNDTRGCAIDLARVLFFGPMAFVSRTSAGRMTASPHNGTSSSRTSGQGRGGSSTEAPKNDDNQARCQSDSVPNTDKEEGAGVEEESAIGASSRKRQRSSTGISYSLATPLKKITSVETDVTPSPQVAKQEYGMASACEEGCSGNNDAGDQEHRESKSASGTACFDGVVTFSCNIVEAIVSYYQSLLTRGVVLDRFSSKDLAFSCWVVCRNMDVSALRNHAGPTRRDTLLISMRHFYYELLSEQIPKKTLPPQWGRHTAGSSRQKLEDDCGDEPSRDGKSRANRGPQSKQQSDGPVDVDEVKKRSRSRLEPTRTIPLALGARCRRQGTHKEEQSGVDGAPNEGRIEDMGVNSVDSSKHVEATGQGEMASNKRNHALEECSLTPTANTAALCETGEDPGAAPVAKPRRPRHSVPLEEVWRPIRSARRRYTHSSGGDDPSQSTVLVSDQNHLSSSAFRLSVLERIKERMADDPIYSSLLTAFPSRTQPMNGGDGCNRKDMQTEERKSAPANGMHPGLIRLLRYFYVEPTTAPIPLYKFNTNDDAVLDASSHKPEPEPHIPSSSGVRLSGDGCVAKTEPKDMDGIFSTHPSPSIKTTSNELCGDAALVKRPFSALTYAQQCILTWEASLLLCPLKTPCTKRRHGPETSAKPDTKPTNAFVSRRYYDYWKNEPSDHGPL
ncbi:hypothetical protein ERJ75_000246900 [Trypanosoma vivax]|nr:hypothetical protein TRVL_06343 [Trypanosoma vivax]KAH8618675.1 hypothetical protein ERJ75_000246900 [Trypanosoma vivax]